MRNEKWVMIMIALALALISVGRAKETPGEDAPAKPVRLPPGVTLQKDIEYVPGGGTSRMLDLYLPPSSGQPVPFLMFVHGGGWHSGSKEGCPAQFLAGHGYAVASINYRFIPQAPFPAQIEDCRAALRFLRAQATKYNLQPDHVAVWGGSAGGHLVNLLGTAAAADFSTVPATMGKVDEPIRVQCVIDMYGPTDFVATMSNRPPGKEVKQSGILGPYKSAEELMARAKWLSPVTYISKDTPPFLIQHGDADKTVPLDQSREFLAALRAAGIEATLMVLPGAGHAGGAFFTEENHKVLVKFLGQHLKSGN
jgi:acetyl esterase/lipase